MQSQTILLIVLAILAALGIAYFHYFRKKQFKNRRWFLGALRFTTIFSGLLLLINPEFSRNTYSLEKGNLIVLVDNSSSIAQLNQQEVVEGIIGQFSQNNDLSGKFSTQWYSFSDGMETLDSLDFKGSRTNIAKSLSLVQETYLSNHNAVVVVTDGNQNYGTDYEFLKLGNNTNVFPIVVGDTTTYQDLRFGQVNSNKYAFLDNQFPLEAQVVYSGDSNIESNLRVTLDGTSVHTERLTFGKDNRTKTVHALLKANTTGLKNIVLSLTPLANERNKTNNTQEIAIEVIDEKTVVGIVSSFKHPDLGALKKAIEYNEQREVRLLSPEDSSNVFAEMDVFVLYQPDSSFGSLYDFLEKSGTSTFTITGPETDWDFLSTKIQVFEKENLGQSEEILPTKNEAFLLFDISGFAMNGFPPLLGELGGLNFSRQPEVIAYQRIKGIDLPEPLFFVMNEEPKQAYVLGANIWKWRLQTHRQEKSFVAFDEMMGKVMFFLSNSNKRDRLQVDFQNTYQSASEAVISAMFFDNTFVFDSNASLSLQVKGVENGFERDVPMLLSGNQFKADLSDLEQGKYNFTVTENKERISKSGRFTILDFALEKQLLAANDDKLYRLAQNNSGRLYYPDQVSDLVSDLLGNQQFVPVQKSTKKVVSLIDFRIVLAIMALALALEWFIRKYNGLL